MKTSFTQLFGIQYPIVQGGMAWSSGAKLAAAVSEAGGFGTIGVAYGADWMREQIRLAKQLTDKPFAVNVPLLSPDRDTLFDIVIKEKAPAIAMGAGKPTPEIMQRFKAAGIRILSVVPTLKAALTCRQLGADVIIIEGTEAGGHIGELSTLVLMGEIIPEIDIPVIAAGGFSDGRGLAAALVMGAAGIQMGTAFMCSEECEIHANAKQAILAAQAQDSTVTGSVRRRTGATRGIKNAFSATFHQLEDGGASLDELGQHATGSGRRGLIDGDTENGFVAAGQVAGCIKSIRPAGDIVRTICADAAAILKNAPALAE